MRVKVFAPAKVNLTLQVGRAGADGRHMLRGQVMFADVGDWVGADAGDVLSLHVTGPFAGDLEGERDNLVLRAARALDAAAGGAQRGAALSLEKHLPVASGLGGGSSDAAAALKALNQLWELGFDEARLADIAAQLGADVPACVTARPGLMSGTGETFEAGAALGCDAVLVNAGAPLSTAEVYRQFDSMGLGGGFADNTEAEAGNDLEAPALALLPAMADVRDALSAGEGVVRVAMSGSGATWFALTDGPERAHAFADALARAHPAWWVRATKLGGA